MTSQFFVKLAMNTKNVHETFSHCSGIGFVDYLFERIMHLKFRVNRFSYTCNIVLRSLNKHRYY